MHTASIALHQSLVNPHPTWWDLAAPNIAEPIRLESRLNLDLPSLSPRLRAVAKYCLAHARRLHLCRIQDVAQECDTNPATVVRLAKRYGFRGYLDFKMAFLVSQSSTNTFIKSECINAHRAESVMGYCRRSISQLEATWKDQALLSAVNALRHAKTVWILCTDETAQIAKCYAELLRLAGLEVQQMGMESGTHQYERLLGVGDAILFISLMLYSKGYLDAITMAERHGLAIVVVADHLKDVALPAANAHLTVAELGIGMQGTSAAMVLAQAVYCARITTSD